MTSFALFTDASVNPQLKLGVGGYLFVPLSLLDAAPDQIRRNEITTRLITRRFGETSSTKLEIQTLLWALEAVEQQLAGQVLGPLQIYTDSQCITGLAGRRERLTAGGFIGKRSGKTLSNATLYRAFYEIHDKLGFQLAKVKGHSRSASHDTVDRIFSYLDNRVREELALWLANRAVPPYEQSVGIISQT